jgi:hypothetical protein
MTALRHMMINDLQLAGMSEKTQEAFIEKRINNAKDMEHAKADKMKEIIKFASQQVRNVSVKNV